MSLRTHGRASTIIRGTHPQDESPDGTCQRPPMSIVKEIAVGVEGAVPVSAEGDVQVIA